MEPLLDSGRPTMHFRSSTPPLRVAFVGGTGYGRPLGRTFQKKFQELTKFADVFVLGLAPTRWPERFTDGAHFQLFPRSRIPVLRYLTVGVFVTLWACWLIVRHRVQVLIAQSPYDGVAAVVARGMARLLGRKAVVVIESHADLYDTFFMERRITFPRITLWVMRRVARFTVRRADLLRAVSRSTAEQLKSLAPNTPLATFPAWTDHEAFEGVPDRSAAGDSVTILFAGVLIPRKGVLELLNAFSRVLREFPDARLVVVGREENAGYVALLRQRVDALGIEPRVRFLGQIDQNALAEWMQRARAFVLPSYSEGLPRVVLEAMLTATPVIASRVSGIPEIITHERTGLLVEPGNVDELAANLLRILRSPEEAERMGVAARAFVGGVLSSERYRESYRSLLEQASALAS